MAPGHARMIPGFGGPTAAVSLRRGGGNKTPACRARDRTRDWTRDWRAEMKDAVATRRFVASDGPVTVLGRSPRASTALGHSPSAIPVGACVGACVDVPSNEGAPSTLYSCRNAGRSHAYCRNGNEASMLERSSDRESTSAEHTRRPRERSVFARPVHATGLVFTYTSRSSPPRVFGVCHGIDDLVRPDPEDQHASTANNATPLEPTGYREPCSMV